VPGANASRPVLRARLSAAGAELSKRADALNAKRKVVFGSTVELEDVTSSDVVAYQIVGEDEADIKQGKLSITSPIARALIGKYPGDQVEVQTPGGVRAFEIVNVRYE